MLTLDRAVTTHQLDPRAVSSFRTGAVSTQDPVHGSHQFLDRVVTTHRLGPGQSPVVDRWPEVFLINSRLSIIDKCSEISARVAAGPLDSTNSLTNSPKQYRNIQLDQQLLLRRPLFLPLVGIRPVLVRFSSKWTGESLVDLFNEQA